MDHFTGAMSKGGAWLDDLDEQGHLRLNPEFRPSFCIDPLAAFEDYGHSETDDYEKHFGCKVRFIGFLSYSVSSASDGTRWVSGADHLLIDEHGRLFWVDYVVTLIGDTIEHALNNLILDTGMQRWDGENNAPGTRTAR